MTRCAFQRGVSISLLIIAAGCGDDEPTEPRVVDECTGPVSISVSPGTAPTFSWTPDCAVGQLLVEEGASDRWGAWADGANTIASPVRYGVAPTGTELEPADALIAGQTYRVTVHRVVSVGLDSLEILGSQEFIP